MRESPSSKLDLRSSSLWAGVQLPAILLGASEFPLWAHHPYPHSSLTLRELVVTQLCMAALLCPVLAPSWTAIFTNLMLSLAFSSLAGLVAGASAMVVFLAWLLISVWAFGLCGWTRQLRPGHRTYVVFCATLFLGGGAIIDYLQAEAAATSGEMAWPHLAMGLLTVNPEKIGATQWGEGVVPLLGWLLWNLNSSFSTARKSSSTSLHRADFR